MRRRVFVRNLSALGGAVLVFVALGGRAVGEEQFPGLAWAVRFGCEEGVDISTPWVDASDNLKAFGHAQSDDFPVTGKGYFLLKVTPAGQVQLTDIPTPAEFHPELPLDGKHGADGNIYSAQTVQVDVIPHDAPVMPDIKETVRVMKISLSGQVLWAHYFHDPEWNKYTSVTGYAVDASCTVFVTGITADPTFPTTEGLDRTLDGDDDAFVAAVSSTGQLLWSTFLGGSDWEKDAGVVIMPDGNIMVFAYTFSSDLPTPGGFQTAYGGNRDFYIAKIFTSEKDGHVPGTIAWASYLGGEQNEHWYDYQYDRLDGVVFDGETVSKNFPGRSVEHELHDDRQFIAKVTSDGQLSWVKFLCRENYYHDEAGAFTVNAAGEIHWATIYDHLNNAMLKISPAGTLLWRKDLGGAQFDWGELTANSDGTFTARGSMDEDGFLVKNGFQEHYGGGDCDGVLLSLDADAELIWSTYLGGSEADPIGWTGSDGQGGLYVMGDSKSPGIFRQIGNAPLDGSHMPFVARVTLTPLTISPESLPQATVGLGYSAGLTAEGGMPPYSWSVVSGSLPGGLAVGGSTGVISGTPTATCTETFTVEVTDTGAIPRHKTKEFSITVVEDKAGPSASGAATLPSVVREGIDTSVTLTATADDTGTGGIPIGGAEYFIGPAGDPDTGTAMAAADGAMDSALEQVTAAVDTSAWTVAGGGRTVNIRAKDALDNWGEVVSLVIPVVDGTAPAAVTDLRLSSAPSITRIHGEAWETGGANDRQEQTLTIDLGETELIGGVGLAAENPVALFPRHFRISVSQDGVEWKSIAAESEYSPALGVNVWLTDPLECRYIRVAAMPERNRADGLYYIRVPEVCVYRSPGGNRVCALWKAPADDGAYAPSGAATAYDLRYSVTPINEANFLSGTQAAGPAAPKAPGKMETEVFCVGTLAGTVYSAVKTCDEAPNWSDLSNVAAIKALPTGFCTVGTNSEVTATAGAAVQLVVSAGEDVLQAFVEMSDNPDFPAKPIKNPDGGISRTVRFPLAAGATWWKPSRPQWLAIKRLAAVRHTVYWRLSGRSSLFARVATSAKALLFETQEITGMQVSVSHEVSGEDAVWPDRSQPPTFSWTDTNGGMYYHYVDVSTDETIPLGDRRLTAALGPVVGSAGSYKVKTAEWVKIRKLATAGEGVLYWRVRATDKDKAFKITSAVRKLAVDGGEWTTSDIDWGAGSPQVSWTCGGQGIARFRLEFSSTEGFEGGPKTVVLIAVRSPGVVSYVFSRTDIKRIRALAARNGASTLYYRVRGEDANRAFITYSETKSVNTQ